MKGQAGQFFPATNGNACFVPDHCLGPRGALSLYRYTRDGWASMNCGVQKTTGSHLFPLQVEQAITPSPELLAKFAAYGIVPAPVDP